MNKKYAYSNKNKSDQSAIYEHFSICCHSNHIVDLKMTYAAKNLIPIKLGTPSSS